MTSRQPGGQPGGPPATVQPPPRRPINLAKLADKVYQLMLAEARLDHARGARVIGRERSRR